MWCAFNNPLVRQTLCVGMILQATKQMVGLEPLIYNESKLDLGWVYTIFSFGFMALSQIIQYLIIDKISRKKILMVSFILIHLSLFSLGIASLGEPPNAAFTFLVSEIYIMIQSVCLTTSTILSNEIYSTTYRGIGVGLGEGCSWLVHLLITINFFYLKNVVGIIGCLFLSSAFSALAVKLVYSLVSERLGQPLH